MQFINMLHQMDACEVVATPSIDWKAKVFMNHVSRGSQAARNMPNYDEPGCFPQIHDTFNIHPLKITMGIKPLFIVLFTYRAVRKKFCSDFYCRRRQVESVRRTTCWKLSSHFPCIFIVVFVNMKVGRLLLERAVHKSRESRRIIMLSDARVWGESGASWGK